MSVVLLLVGSIAGACGAQDAAIRSAAPTTLEGTAWRAVEVANQPTVAGAEPSIAFTSPQVSGTTGCNTFGGAYEYAQGKIRFEELRSTAIACEGVRGAIESAYLDALQQASTASIDPDGRLILRGNGGSITSVPAASPAGG